MGCRTSSEKPCLPIEGRFFPARSLPELALHPFDLGLVGLSSVTGKHQPKRQSRYRHHSNGDHLQGYAHRARIVSNVPFDPIPLPALAGPVVA